MKLKRILAATDFSPLGDAAIHRSALLAVRDGAELLIVHAMPKKSVLKSAFGIDDKLPVRMRSVAEKWLAALMQNARDIGISRVDAEIVEGTTRQTMAAVAANFHPELLAIGAHGRGLLQQMFLGGTASRILAHAEIPVLVVRRQPEADYRQALAGVDLGPISDVVIRAAAVVAAQGRITVAHVYQAPFEAKLRYKGIAEEDIAPYAEIEERAAQRNMAALLAESDLTGLNLKSLIIHGNPVEKLSEVANGLGADLIVAGQHGGSRLEETVLGSVTRFLAYYAPCDVLVV